MPSWTQREAHIAHVVDYAQSRLPKADFAAMRGFIHAVLDKAAPEDVILRPVEMLYGILLSMWKFSTRRSPGTARLRVFNPTLEEHGWHSSHTIIQMVNDDMPFLVSSVTGDLALSGTEIHFILHPMVDCPRDADGNRSSAKDATVIRESLIHLEIDRKTAPAVLAALELRLNHILADVRVAVQDWPAMLEKVDIARADLGQGPKAPKADSDTAANAHEAMAFLDWLKDNHFTLLGYRAYSHVPTEAVAGEGLGILRDPARQVFRRGADFIAISDEIRDFLHSDAPMIISKANVKSTVHRPVHLDYVGIKIHDDSGRAVGEHRFVGLFTSVAYSRRAETVPYLRHKVTHMLERARFERRSHDGKALLHILESFPRDELFQIDEDALFETSMGILYLLERPHARAFLRQDPHGRFVSALVYVPRELYESNLRNRIEAILCDAYKGEISARHAQLSDDVIARWHFIIRTRPGQTPIVSAADINVRIAQVARGWRDQLKESLVKRFGEERGIALFERYAHVFPAAYRDNFSPEFTVIDIEKFEASGAGEVQYNFYRLAEDPDDALRLKIYHPSAVIPLSDVMPLLENLGLRVIEEDAYDIAFPDQNGNGEGCLHSFYLREPHGAEIALADVKPRLEDTLHQVAAGRAENDGFNSMVLRAGLQWREVVVLRAYARYLRQLGLAYSEDYVRQTLADNPVIARALVALFEARFNPALDDDSREAESETVNSAINRALDHVTSLDQDRILRAFRNCLLATLRCNYYQTGTDGSLRPALALKINSREVKEAPLPRPYAEIFVYAPRVEGVHLRFGPVARGGLRWSDRPEDFRTEVLGLVKAQQVKNAVIVPVGAKGGFYPKHAPKTGDRDAVLADGVACYKTFISSLLDVTDNLSGDHLIPPENVVRHDGPDPYLVVAADKGTASFSDYANAIAEDCGFWLGDAFASGGSHGYDHKKMAITARGAWISVERHFREHGIDLKTTGISVVGIGDMSGDVFGNGMLRSDKIQLRAAFDHRHIFLDPTPDPAKSYAERQRLYDLPRSSWADYNPKLLSKGGAIIDRKAKSVTLSAEVRAWLGVGEEPLIPNDLIQLVLKANVDLLWIGGIGTYIKAASENNRDVGDRANDALRVNGGDLRCKVVGEGGNLGCTQAGRIEFARTGGAINTDSVDNSAGVNCSDHEVNIKILLNGLEQDGVLSRPDRDKLLVAMTDDVSALVLIHNYLQTLSITLTQSGGSKALDSQARLMTALEKTASLDRSIEGLPSDETIAERRARDEGLTRPEIAILVSYAKMAAKQAIAKHPVAEDSFFNADLAAAFPPRLSATYGDALAKHRLRPEIIATVLANEMINRMGPGFVHTVSEQADCELADVARGYAVVREIYGLKSLWQQIDALDDQVPASVQTRLYLDVAEFTRLFTIWLLRRMPRGEAIAHSVARLMPGIEDMISAPLEILDTVQLKRIEAKAAVYEQAGVAKALALRIGALEAHATTGDIVELAHDLGRPVEDVARAYYYLGDSGGYTWLRTSTEEIPSGDHWERLAAIAIIEDILDQQRSLTERALGGGTTKTDGVTMAQTWIAANDAALRRANVMVSELHNTNLTPAKLGYATRHLRALLLR
ncbi:NAD-glutamate dehydrogenase [Govanella unica]|uniref:NAD-glutamate dehydrogenase n=1 Tax=Govanella unica TaxID=2975056 RepID=A0A9X3Z5Z8_9PROT|nr:NAD-glutamate dehydrogenase [Govania unica]MDA5192409.1 NAD-glutamate dehydrogenase [Govania unica]